MNRKVKFALIGVGLALAHLAVTTTLIVYAFARGMEQFDRGVLPTPKEQMKLAIVETVGDVLMSPGIALYEMLPRELKVGNVLEWAFVLANSLVWGFGMLLIWRMLKKRFATKK